MNTFELVDMVKLYVFSKRPEMKANDIRGALVTIFGEEVMEQMKDRHGVAAEDLSGLETAVTATAYMADAFDRGRKRGIAGMEDELAEVTARLDDVLKGLCEACTCRLEHGEGCHCMNDE